MNPFPKIIAVVFFFFIGLLGPAIPAEQKQSIEIIDQSHDPVGTQLVFAIKERFRASQTFDLTGPVGTRSQMVITTTKPEDNNLNRAIYSVIWLYPPTDKKYPYSTYISSTLGSCDKSSLDETAKAIVAQTSKVLDASTDELVRSLLKDYGK